MAEAQPAAYRGLELLATAIVILDGGYSVRYTNPAAENLLGAGARALVGQPFPALFPKARRSKACWPRRWPCTGVIALRR